MKKLLPATVICLMAAHLLSQSVSAQVSTPPAAPEELEAVYTSAIEKRASAILTELDLKEPAKEAMVHDAVIAFYRALRARDAVIDIYFQALGRDTSFTNEKRQPYSEQVTEPVRELFVGTLETCLTPDQVETVKDKLTYNKVQVTRDAYNDILPNLKDDEKARVLSLLEEARDKAITGGSSQEKTAVFEAHKERINEFLNSKGYDVAKATEEWEARQAQTASARTQPGGQ